MLLKLRTSSLFFFNDTATTEIYTLSLHDALPISGRDSARCRACGHPRPPRSQRRWTRPRRSPRSGPTPRSEEHTSELQSHLNLVCRLLLEKKKILYEMNKSDKLMHLKQAKYTVDG